MNKIIRRRALVLVATLVVATNVAYAATVSTNDLIEPTFVFRALLTGLLTLLTWYANKLINKVDLLERELTRVALATQRIDTNEKVIASLRQEDHQIQTQINLLRERMLSEYHTKQETREHYDHVEELLKDLRTELRNLCLKFEHLQERFYERRQTPRSEH